MNTLYKNKLFNLAAVTVLITQFPHGVCATQDNDEKDCNRKAGILKVKKENKISLEKNFEEKNQLSENYATISGEEASEIVTNNATNNNTIKYEDTTRPNRTLTTLSSKKVLEEHTMDPRIIKLDPFYNGIKDIANKARDNNQNAIEEVTNFPLKFKNDALEKKVRVSEEKAEGYKRGVGLDEFFQTAKTPYFLRWDAGLIEGKKPSSPLKSGKEFGCLDAQQYLRVPTSEPIYKDDKGNITGAHAGAIFRGASPNRSGILKGQPGAHDKRQAAIEKSSTPANAVLRAIRSHLESTASAKNYRKGLSFKAYDTKDRDLSNPTDWEAFVEERLKGRDRVKYTYKIIKMNLQEDSDASTLSSYETSSYDYSNSLEETIVINAFKDIQSLLYRK